jgi:hypothetical protein
MMNQPEFINPQVQMEPQEVKDLERKSSSVTLSDMEVFIFPELIYSLLLANIMSPLIWRWREDPWFTDVEKMKPYRRILRVKQYIMDHYMFNLDLDTWGLTTKEKELARFSSFISEETLRQSNALFGYEGDKYYFDIDIRTHFGLNKYEGNVIPYWKTETVEAMNAFIFKAEYKTGAGECVSLAVLYAAALFIIARVPLKDIYLMATPLHSQTFIDIDDGILTNNRRLVTKNMWYNGTVLSAQARRALENERVTIVAHESGHIHTIYKEATIDANTYDHFARRLQNFLITGLTPDIFVNFLRQYRAIQKFFQIRWPCRGHDHYLPAERAFDHEDGRTHQINVRTRHKVMDEVDCEELGPVPLPYRIILNDLEEFVEHHDLDLHNPQDLALLRHKLTIDGLDSESVVGDLVRFCEVVPTLPNPGTKLFTSHREGLNIAPDMTRKEIIERLSAIRGLNEAVGLAFYAYRDLNSTEVLPFLLAAIERNPVSIEGAGSLDDVALVQRVIAMPGESIYEEAGRLAQPDEVWNFGRGDGVEKALLIANILRRKLPFEEISVSIHTDTVVLRIGTATYTFTSQKGLKDQVWRVSPTLEVETGKHFVGL